MRRLTGRVVLATHNKGKAAEFARLLAPFGVEIVSAGELGLDAPEETGATFEDNARLKAQAASAATGLPALADDSGLEVDALDGAPGVHSADWAETPQGRDYPMAMRKVRDALEARSAPEPWRAAFRCQLCLIWPDGAETQIAGRAPGRLVWPPRGEVGFGFDPMFIPDAQEGEQSFAELAPEEKNRLSHRADAFARLAAAHLGDSP